MNGEDGQAIRRAIDDLQRAASAMAQHVQGQQRGGAGGPSADGAGQERRQPDEDVIDADFEVAK